MSNTKRQHLRRTYLQSVRDRQDKLPNTER